MATRFKIGDRIRSRSTGKLAHVVDVSGDMVKVSYDQWPKWYGTLPSWYHRDYYRKERRSERGNVTAQTR